MSFRVGDIVEYRGRVRYGLQTGDRGVVVVVTRFGANLLGIRFDRNNEYMHSLDNQCTDGHGLWFSKDGRLDGDHRDVVVLVEKRKKLYNNGFVKFQKAIANATV